MKKAVVILFIFVLTACANEPEPVEEITVPQAPQIISPADGDEFVASDVELTWDYAPLTDNQRYVLRLWYGDNQDDQREVWLLDNDHIAQEQIDSYSRDLGQFHWQVAVVNVDDTGGFDSMASDWSETSSLNRVRRLSIDPVPEVMRSDFANYLIEQNFEDDFVLVNHARDFVHNNTNITSPDPFAPDYSDAVQMMYDHAFSDGAAPNLYCDGMSVGILSTLQQLGIESRPIFLYGEVPGWISQHTFLEVFNRDTQQWEVHDPTLNYYFVDMETGNRASVDRLVFGSLDAIDLCTTDGDCQSIFEDDYIPRHLQTFRYGHTNEVWVNPDRFDISRRIDAFDNANFPEFLSSITGYSANELVFRFDS